MTRRERCRAEILVRPLVGPMVFFPDATWFVYLAGGTASVKGQDSASAIAAREAVLLPADPAGERVVVDGGGEVVLVKFLPADAQSWDDASNNRALIAGNASLIYNPPSAWAVAVRDNANSKPSSQCSVEAKRRRPSSFA